MGGLDGWREEGMEEEEMVEGGRSCVCFFLCVFVCLFPCVCL